MMAHIMITYYKYCRCVGTQNLYKYHIYVNIYCDYFQNNILKIDKWTLNKYIYLYNNYNSILTDVTSIIKLVADTGFFGGKIAHPRIITPFLLGY